VDRSVTYDQVKKVALKIQRRLLQRVGSSHVYQGDKLMAWRKKPMPLKFSPQIQENTLTDKGN